MTSLSELVIGTYLGTGVPGDSPYTSANTATITLGAAISIAGPITIHGGIILAQQNITSTLSGADILLQATGYIDLAASQTIQTNNGDITFRANSGGTAVAVPNSTTGAITLNSGSSLLSTGGNITLGGNFTGTKGAGLYAASGRTGGAPGILISNATITAAGGSINIYGRCTTSYDDGIRLQATITTTGSGTIGIYGDSHGGLTGGTPDIFFGGITFITNSSTIETDAGNINIEATLTNTQSNSTHALNFYRTVYTSGTTGRHIQLLSRSGNIQVTGDRGSTSAGGMGSSSWGNIYAGSPLSGTWTASGNVTFSYSSFVGAGANGIITKTTGAVVYEPTSTSFSAAQTFPYNANYTLASSASSLTIGKPGNSANITIATAQTVAGDVSIYGGTVTLTGAVTATGSTLTLGASTALTQAAAISASSLLLSGAGTFTLSNTGNNVATIAGGTSGSRLGSLSYTDASGGLTIGTIGSTSGIYTTGALLVETLTGDINLTESVSSNATTSNALIVNAGKSSAIGTNTGGNILVSGTPTVTVGSGGIGKLFSGLETNSTGLTTLVGGSGNVRYDYDETTTTFSPTLSGNNNYAIYRTNYGTGDLTIVASGGDAINSKWVFDNGTISTTSGTVNINASELVTYLSSGALTIEAGNVTISSAITSSAANAFVINSNGEKTITVSAAVSLGGAATFNSNVFTLGSGINISTSTASDITINTNAGFSTTNTTRRTISSAGGNIVIHADKDANGSGALDLDYLTINPGAGNIIIRGETAAFNVGTASPYINGTGTFTFESSDASFGQLMYTSWFSIDQDGNGISALTLGKAGSTADVEVNTNISIGGPISIYGGYVNVNGNLTSSATGDIFIKGIAGTNPSIWIQSGNSITKSGGTGTLTLQGHGRVTHQGSITTSGTGVMNVIFWSDFDNDNDDGGVSQQGTISTNGGHVWLGGSGSNGGSYTWNGLTVGDGPSIGSTGFNGNAMDIYGNITTNGGDFLAWAGSTVSSGGIAGIANDGSGDIVSVGSGNIVLITDMVYGSAGAAMYFTQSGGTFTLVPHEGSFRSTFNWNPAIQTYVGSTADDYNLQTGDFDWLGIGELNSITSLTIGYYNGMLNGGTPVEFTNSSNVTFSTATTSAGAFHLYGGAISMNTSLTTTSATNGNISINGISISGTGNLAVAAGRNATINVSSTSTYDGIISGSGSAFTKSGAGLIILTKDHTYSGSTTISGGYLQVGTGGSVSQASSGTISNTSAVAVSSGSKLVLSPNENITFAAPVSGDGGVEVKGASGLYRSTALTTTASLMASNVSVLEVLTRITGGTFTGSAASGNCGAYQKSYNAATNTATLQFQQVVSSITKVVFVTLERINITDVAIRGTGAAYRSGDYLGQNMATIGGTTALTFPTQYGISQVFMSGKVNFTGALTYTGTTTLSNMVTSATAPTYSYTSRGTQEITDASSSFPGPIVNNGLVILNRSTPLTIAGDMSGTEDVLQVGAAVTLTGTNTHTGTTTIDLNKTLNVGSGGSTGSMTGNIVNYGALTFNRTGSSTYPGVLSGTGSLTKSGTGDLTMNNLNTYTGATTINGGTLILEQDVPTSSSSGFTGAGALTIQPSSASFTSAVTWPIPGTSPRTPPGTSPSSPTIPWSSRAAAARPTPWACSGTCPTAPVSRRR
ncbi:MAG: autotransporter-associated beta strand repeat-containing protein [Chitinophagaceae bacterium]|nr:autotransporter-associated beta strand repeat-containing protein [Chitinophagaceae bacterium]